MYNDRSIGSTKQNWGRNLMLYMVMIPPIVIVPEFYLRLPILKKKGGKNMTENKIGEKKTRETKVTFEGLVTEALPNRM